MPVVFNEPLSFLQRMSEYMEYAHLLRTASQQPDPLSRMQYVIGNNRQADIQLTIVLVVGCGRDYFFFPDVSSSAVVSTWTWLNWTEDAHHSNGRNVSEEQIAAD